MILTAGIESADGKSYFGETGVKRGEDVGAGAVAAATVSAPGCGAFQTAVNFVTWSSKT